MLTHVRAIITQTLHALSIPQDRLQITIPEDPHHGDYTTNIALIHARDRGVKPTELANTIAHAIPTDGLIDRAEAVGPGFVNIFLKVSHLLSHTASYDPGHTLSSPLTGQRYTVEYTDPNPFKELHIGHLYSNTVGESIARMLESVGVQVRRVNYQGDVGIHVACSIWGMIAKTQSTSSEQGTGDRVQGTEVQRSLDQIEQLPLNERVKWLGECYAMGATAYKDDAGAKRDIQLLNAQIFSAGQAMWKRTRPDFTPRIDYTKLVTSEYVPQDIVDTYYTKGRQWTLDYFETIYRRLGTHYGDAQNYYFESHIADCGYDLVMQHIEDGVFVRSEGAVVFPGEKYGLHTRVFINSFGLPTYEAKEMGLNPTKYADWPFDCSLIVTADEIEEYFKVVLKAMSIVAPDVASRTTHIPHGVVRLPEGKMSSRTGKIVGAEALIDEVKSRLRTKVQESSRIPESDLDSTIERLAVASIKYSFLRSSLGKDVVFDFDQSLSFEGDSGPYLLYTIVRCKSILAKAPADDTSQSCIEACASADPQILDDADVAIMRLLIHMPDTIIESVTHRTPHVLCTYLHHLAQEFNTYYGHIPIIQSDAGIRRVRLAIVTRVMQSLSHGVHLLGCEVVERM